MISGKPDFLLATFVSAYCRDQIFFFGEGSRSNDECLAYHPEHFAVDTGTNMQQGDGRNIDGQRTTASSRIIARSADLERRKVRCVVPVGA